MNSPIELTTEQMFSLKTFEMQVKKMSPEQAQTMLLDLYRQMMLRESAYKHLLRHQWNIEPLNLDNLKNQ